MVIVFMFHLLMLHNNNYFATYYQYIQHNAQVKVNYLVQVELWDLCSSKDIPSDSALFDNCQSQHTT